MKTLKEKTGPYLYLVPCLLIFGIFLFYPFFKTIYLSMGFSLLRALEFFVDPKNGNARNQNPPAMRVETNCYTKNHLSATIELFRHYCKKGKVILWQKRITI